MKQKPIASLIILLMLMFILLPGIGYCELETLDDSELSSVNAQASASNNSQTMNYFKRKDGVNISTSGEGADLANEANSPDNSKLANSPSATAAGGSIFSSPANNRFDSFSPNQGFGAGGGMLPDHSCCR